MLRRINQQREMAAAIHPFKEARKMNKQLQATISGHDLPGHSAVKPQPKLSPCWRNRTGEESSKGSGNDLSAFGIALTVIFGLATAAAYSDHPVIWLIVGPVAIVLLFFAARMLHVSLLQVLLIQQFLRC